MRKKFTCSLIGQAGVMLALGVLSGADASAKHLSPEDALSMVQSGARKIVSASPLKLAYVQESESEEPAVYVFNRENAPGFYVLAADDGVGNIVLGYSDDSYYSADNMSPGMQWLLEAYSKHVVSCADGKVKAAAQVPADWSAIEPLITTKWTQTAPYNDMCPVVLGERSISGCVSVAVAQIMKKHQWPKTGKGSCSYSYILNGQQYDISSDFSKHRYDWDNMLDSYTGVSTQAQKDAVAQLIFDCGVTAQTRYIPDGYTIGSSGSNVDAAKGLIEYFDYDKSMCYNKRDWFSEKAWYHMLYGQVAQGLPVLYSGQSGSGGHSFVLDGYDGGGKFHFNMGWAGLDDGYYSLDALEYGIDQTAIINIYPNCGSAGTPVFGVVDVFSTDREEYSSTGDEITFHGKFCSYSLFDVTAEIGVQNTDNGGVIPYNTYEFKPNLYLASFKIPTGKFPRGEYDVYPVFKPLGGDWTTMKYNVTESGGYLHFINDGTTIKVNIVDADGIVSAISDAVSVSAANGCIHVEAPCDAKVSVYDAAGTLCYAGADKTIHVVTNRIYIVVVGEKVFKVKA